MPRTARLYYPGGIFHIISRFDRREFLMPNDTHRKRYLGLLAQTVKGSLKNKNPELWRRGARPARRDDAGLVVPIQGGATPRDGMDRRHKMGSYFFARP